MEHEVINFAASIGHAAIELELAHEYENEPDLPFEDYDALFMIRDFDSNLDREEATARQIFRCLSALNKYSLMLVLDLDVLLDSFTPTHEGPQRS
ncbi:hypothetical protein [Streptomyces sp. B6B3]|uniref:hypothetical protein n=1 Tax=Streptomyces sp. B6B3 TaxID=3153570 RepID=UPI00325C4844